MVEIMKFSDRGNHSRDDACSQPRRQFLMALAALGAGALLPAKELLAQTGALATRTGRLDVHHHIVPPSLLKALGTQRLAGASVLPLTRKRVNLNRRIVTT
jgi:hypothetical protein